ncbi:hypothetical protein LINPERPRIM_LOCUS40591 [Linum perenne]
MSAREAIAAQEAAELAAAAAAEEEEEYGDALEVGDRASGISLMDLLEETDREMGVEGGGGRGGTEHACCVCMVRHKGAALIPSCHTFCRLCSRELWVQRGNCPLCNGFILEILDIL